MNWFIVFGIGCFAMMWLSRSGSGPTEQSPRVEPKFPGSDEPVATAPPTAHQALDALLLLRARLRATGSTPDEVAKLCDPLAALLMREEVAQ